MATNQQTYQSTSRGYAGQESGGDTVEMGGNVGLQRYLRSNPGVAVLAAFFVGFLAARLILGRK